MEISISSSGAQLVIFVATVFALKAAVANIDTSDAPDNFGIRFVRSLVLFILTISMWQWVTHLLLSELGGTEFEARVLAFIFMMFVTMSSPRVKQ